MGREHLRCYDGMLSDSTPRATQKGRGGVCDKAPRTEGRNIIPGHFGAGLLFAVHEIRRSEALCDSAKHACDVLEIFLEVSRYPDTISSLFYSWCSKFRHVQGLAMIQTTLWGIHKEKEEDLANDTPAQKRLQPAHSVWHVFPSNSSRGSQA